MRVACIIPSYNGRVVLERLLDSLSLQSQPFTLLVVDSSSTDGTPELVRSRGASLTTVSPSDFNHGATRQMMVDTNPDYDVYVFMTQDAYLATPNDLERMLKYFTDPEVGVVCGRQLPHTDATLLAAHARYFNYPATVRIKTLQDVQELGIKTAFISNSFSAYRARALKEAGGFPSHVILSEDMYVAAKMLLKGWKVAYAGDACCYHSHNYTLLAEFRRYFDQGVFQSRESWIGDSFGGVGGEGLRYVRSELDFLGARRIVVWPASLIRNFLKLAGFKLGKMERHLPASLKKILSMHQRYWDTE